MKNMEPTVFIVDDDPAVRDALAMLLRLEGFRAESYSGAQAFLQTHDFTQPGCLVLDVDMPGVNGLELQEILVVRGFHLPVIFATGRSDAAIRTRALKGGAVGFIEKPFPCQVLLEHIRIALGQNKASKPAEDLVTV